MRCHVDTQFPFTLRLSFADINGVQEFCTAVSIILYNELSGGSFLVYTLALHALSMFE